MGRTTSSEGLDSKRPKWEFSECISTLPCHIKYDMSQRGYWPVPSQSAWERHESRILSRTAHDCLMYGTVVSPRDSGTVGVQHILSTCFGMALFALSRKLLTL